MTTIHSKPFALSGPQSIFFIEAEKWPLYNKAIVCLPQKTGAKKCLKKNMRKLDRIQQWNGSSTKYCIVPRAKPSGKSSNPMRKSGKYKTKE